MIKSLVLIGVGGGWSGFNAIHVCMEMLKAVMFTQVIVFDGDYYKITIQNRRKPKIWLTPIVFTTVLANSASKHLP